MSHSRKPAVTFAALVTLITALTAVAARAAPFGLELVAYLDRPGGREILERQYDAAIELAEAQIAKPNAPRRLVAYTNLCVAQTKIGRFEAAKAACDMALSLAEKHDRSAEPRRRMEPMPAVARALSNRGVLLFMLGETRAALDDFAAADALDHTSWDAPERNMAYVIAAEPGAPSVALSTE